MSSDAELFRCRTIIEITFLYLICNSFSDVTFNVRVEFHDERKILEHKPPID